MAILRSTDSEQQCNLVAEHLVGRSARCDLQLEETYVSSQHASIRWSGECWEIRDLGSRNGTWLDGQRLEPFVVRGHGYRLTLGALVAFGQPSKTWTLSDASPPRPMIVELSDGRALFLEDDMIGIPSTACPEAAVVRGADGRWLLECSDGSSLRIADGSTFEVQGRAWKFYCPNLVVHTSAVEERASVRAITLRFEVSSDEEHVELSLEAAGKSTPLGSRAHNYVLLTLARHRLQDMKRGIHESACGWVYQDELLRKLATSATQLNVDIFRIRSQFGALGLHDPALVVERRPRTKQLRIGVASIAIKRA